MTFVPKNLGFRRFRYCTVLAIRVFLLAAIVVVCVAPANAACTAPAGEAGQTRYNADEGVPQYCNGTDWIGFREPNPILPDPCAGSPSPGDVCADGTVYAGLSPDGDVKMFTTAADEGGFAWNNGNNSNNTATGQTSAITGKTNTMNLLTIDSDSSVAGTQPHLAAQQCANSTANGHTDWYLPAKGELNILYDNRAAIGGFNTGLYPAGWYWSSSELNNLNAWIFNFGFGGLSSSGKAEVLSVRCVRR